MADKLNRCFGEGNPLYEKYHDSEWGVPVHDDLKLFEMLCLESAQAGLSWAIILKKRSGYRKAFYNFNPIQVSNMEDSELEKLRQNPDIIRNKLKIYAFRTNAKIFLDIRSEYGSFDKYIWQFTEGKIIKNKWENIKQIPSETNLSRLISKDLSKRGMKFVGSKIIYAYLQAIGIVNDHVKNCWKFSVS